MVTKRLVLILFLSILSLGLAQYTHAPYATHTEALGSAHGFEMLEMRLQGLSYSEEVEDEMLEEIEGAFERDLARIQGSLAVQDPELAEALEEALEAIETLIRAEDDGLYEALDEALALTAQARSLVIPVALAQDPAFHAALMATILLAEEGVAERFEEAAAGEETAYLGGYAALQRIKLMWLEIEDLANETQAFEVNDMLAELDSLFPGTEQPGEEAFIDAEAAEDPAQRMVGFLEEISDAALYPDRDLGQLIALSRDLTVSACEAIAAGDEAAGMQRLRVAGFYYGQYLANTLNMMTPEANENLAPLWLVFSEEGEEDEDDDDEEHNGDEDVLHCPDLLENFEDITAMFGV